MQVELPYGKTKLKVEVPDEVVVLESRRFPGLADERRAIEAALREPVGCPPLAEWVKRGGRVTIVHTDITRATPNRRLLPPLIDALEAAGAAAQDITLVNALGTHRMQTEAETRELLGDRIVDGYRCLQHDCNNDADLIPLGVTSRGHPVRVNRHYLEADLRILTGFIEPHFFAGFSGGPKGVLPSIAGAESVQTNHGYEMLNHPNATWCVTEGNPVWEEMREAAGMAGPAFLLNVALNREQQISGVFAGDVIQAHRAGCDFVRQTALVPIERLFDVVITTNGGYPLDQNLYQSLKGISAAARAVKPGGTIIQFAACADGVPAHGMYAQLLREAGSPQRALEVIGQPGFAAPDQWQVQLQAQILLKNRVYVYSDGLSDQQICEALYEPCRDPAALLAELQAQQAAPLSVCVMPEGPQTIPVRGS